VDRNDVRVLQARRSGRLNPEAHDKLRASLRTKEQELDRDEPVEANLSDRVRVAGIVIFLQLLATAPQGLASMRRHVYAAWAYGGVSE